GGLVGNGLGHAILKGSNSPSDRADRTVTAPCPSSSLCRRWPHRDSTSLTVGTMAKGSEHDTPMMQQYRAAKAAHPGMLLLFRMGDFFETFGDDAELASRVLGLTL